MIVENWDHRISDIAKAISTFIEESEYPIKYSQYNTLTTLQNTVTDIDSDILVDYTDNVLNGFAVVQRTDEYHEEYFGYLNKFYILADKRTTRAPFRLIGEVTKWFDDQNCVQSFATATAGIGKDNAFIKLMSRFGYTATPTGMLIRKQHG